MAEMEFDFTTPMDPAAAAQHLRATTHAKMLERRRLTGRVGDRDFKLKYNIFHKWKLAEPILLGQIEPTVDGSKVQVEIRRSHVYYASLAFVAVLIVVAISTVLTEPMNEETIVMPIMAVIMLAFVAFERTRFPKTAANAAAHLEGVFADATAPPTAAP